MIHLGRWLMAVLQGLAAMEPVTARLEVEA